MINLSGKFRYYLCTDNVTLRFRHRGLRGIIRKEKDEYFDEYEDEKIDGEELQELV